MPGVLWRLVGNAPIGGTVADPCGTLLVADPCGTLLCSGTELSFAFVALLVVDFRGVVGRSNV